MADNQKYYYLKLKENFYDSESILILESMPNGYMYSNILLKLYLKSLKGGGKLVFNERIPYNPVMLSTITRHTVEDIEQAIKILTELGLIEILDNGTIYMTDIQNYIGKSTTEADRIRDYRKQIEEEQKKAKGDVQMYDKSTEDDVQMYDKSTPEIEIEKELKKDLELELKLERENIVHPEDALDTLSKKQNKEKEIEDFFEEIWMFYPNKKGKNAVSKKSKEALYQIGKENIQRIIARYMTYVEDQRKRNFDLQYQNGSTFFNGGYLDYTDAAIEESKNQPEIPQEVSEESRKLMKEVSEGKLPKEKSKYDLPYDNENRKPKYKIRYANDEPMEDFDPEKFKDIF